MRLSATASANGRTFRPWLCSGVWPSALDMFEHVIAHGRMFNELDDEMARNVCVIGTATRDELWARRIRSARNSSVGGDDLSERCAVHHHRHVQHYESEQERKLREFTAQQAAKTPAVSGGVARNRGFARRAPGSFAFSPEKRHDSTCRSTPCG
jgi:hypothetical protein